MIHRSNGHGRRADSGSPLHALAQGLGWFSIGLGLAEVLAPRQLARSLGMDEHTRLIGAYGVREIATGIAILTQRQQQEHRASLPDYSNRSGFPRPPEAMRGAARDFEVPRDMRTPELLRPYGVA